MSKEHALRAYRQLLSWGVLPEPLVEDATTADLEKARRDLQETIESRSLLVTDMQVRELWQRYRSFPAQLVEHFGIPWLRSAIRARREREAEEARKARLAEGFEIELRLSAELIQNLAERRFLVGDPEAHGTLPKAIMKAVEFVVGPPPAGFDRPLWESNLMGGR